MPCFHILFHTPACASPPSLLGAGHGTSVSVTQNHTHGRVIGSEFYFGREARSTGNIIDIISTHTQDAPRCLGRHFCFVFSELSIRSSLAISFFWGFLRKRLQHILHRLEFGRDRLIDTFSYFCFLSLQGFSGLGSTLKAPGKRSRVKEARSAKPGDCCGVCAPAARRALCFLPSKLDGNQGGLVSLRCGIYRLEKGAISAFYVMGVFLGSKLSRRPISRWRASLRTECLTATCFIYLVWGRSGSCAAWSGPVIT